MPSPADRRPLARRADLFPEQRLRPLRPIAPSCQRLPCTQHNRRSRRTSCQTSYPDMWMLAHAQLPMSVARHIATCRRPICAPQRRAHGSPLVTWAAPTGARHGQCPLRPGPYFFSSSPDLAMSAHPHLVMWPAAHLAICRCAHIPSQPTGLPPTGRLNPPTSLTSSPSLAAGQRNQKPGSSCSGHHTAPLTRRAASCPPRASGSSPWPAMSYPPPGARPGT